VGIFLDNESTSPPRRPLQEPEYVPKKGDLVYRGGLLFVVTRAAFSRQNLVTLFRLEPDGLTWWKGSEGNYMCNVSFARDLTRADPSNFFRGDEMRFLGVGGNWDE
jgi:hypothetical protein